MRPAVLLLACAFAIAGCRHASTAPILPRETALASGPFDSLTGDAADALYAGCEEVQRSPAPSSTHAVDVLRCIVDGKAVSARLRFDGDEGSARSYPYLNDITTIPQRAHYVTCPFRARS